ncbi:MAG: hypothetical protein AB1505_19185 [Candidatus Latescibacterota bacterium]
MQGKTRRHMVAVSQAGLRRFFERLVQPAFSTLGLGDRALSDYVADMLARFARTDQLYRIRDARGRPLETVAEILIELTRQWGPGVPYSFDREFEIRRHSGDYALFMSGLFRPHVERSALLDYYLAQGRAAYRAAADLGQLALLPEVQLFAALSDRFEHLSGGLDFMRKVYMRPELHAGPYRDLLQDLERP